MSQSRVYDTQVTLVIEPHSPSNRTQMRRAFRLELNPARGRHIQRSGRQDQYADVLRYGWFLGFVSVGVRGLVVTIQRRRIRGPVGMTLRRSRLVLP